MENKINSIGQRYDNSIVIEKFKDGTGNSMSRCLCDCGTIYEIRSRYLKQNKNNSCGCKTVKRFKDEVGKTYGRLMVISQTNNSRAGDARFNCLCICGAETVVQGCNLRSGHTISCGCAMIGEKLYYGEGLYTKGKYSTSVEGKLTKEFTVWVKMIERCYREECWILNPTYEKCTVSENFKNFQYFAEWCQDKKGFNSVGWELDKDLLGDNTYTEETCCFIPSRLNLFIATLKKKKQGDLPMGVTIRGNRFRANIKSEGKKKYLGTFGTAEEAHMAYLESKEVEFYRIILEFSPQLSEKVVAGLWDKFNSFKMLVETKSRMNSKGAR